MYHLIDFCRLCLCFKGEFSNMCNDNVMEKIVACINDLEFDEELPALICTKCSEQLDMFFDFRNQCLRSEFLLKCYVDKFPLAQSCNKFVNTQLKVNVFKNFAPSSKLQSNVQLFKEYSLKPYNNNPKEVLKICETRSPTSNYSSHDYKRSGIILKDVGDAVKSNVNNNEQNEVIQLNKLHSITKGNAHPCVADNDLDTYASDTVLDEEEDDIFLEEEDDEVLQLSNVNNDLNSGDGKRKSVNSDDSLNKKSRLETKQTNRVESHNLNRLENDFLPFNMQADITEHVKISKRKVQIRAQEKIQQALNDEIETKAKKPGNRKKSTSGFYNRTSHNVKRVNIENSKFLNSRSRSRSPNIQLNELHNAVLKTTNNSTINNIEKDKFKSDKLQNFNDNPVIHNINRGKLIDVKLQNIKNSPVATKITKDEFKNPKFHNFVSSLVTCNMQANNINIPKLLNFASNSVIQNIEEKRVKDTKLQDLETNSASMIHNIEKDELKSINAAQDSEKISVFLTRNTEHVAIKKSAVLNETDQVKHTKSQNLENSSITRLQNTNSNTVTRNIETNEVMKCKLQEVRSCAKTSSNEINKIQDAGTNKLDIYESQNWKNNPVISYNKQDRTKKCEPVNINNNLKNYNNILDVDSSSLGNSSVTQLIVINKTVSVESPPLKSIAMTLNEEQKIPLIVSSNLNKCPVPLPILQKTWQKLDEEKRTTNKELNKDKTDLFRLLFVQNTPVVPTNKTVLTPSYPDSSSTYQTVFQSTLDRSFALPINNETYVQNPQTLSTTEMNPHKVKSAVPPQRITRISAKPSRLMCPKQTIAMHDGKPMNSMLKNELLKNSSNSMKSKTSLFKIKNIQHFDKRLLNNEPFNNSANDASNVETNIIVPLHSRDMPVKNSCLLRSYNKKILFRRSLLKSNNKHYSLITRNNEKSVLRISNRESKQLPNIKIADVCSLAENTVVTQLPSNIHSVCEDVKLESKPSLRFDGQSNSKSEDCDAFTIDASLVKENFCMPRDDHNHISNNNYSFLSETPSTSTTSFDNCNNVSVVSTLALKDCHIPHHNHSYNSNTNNTHFLNDIPSCSASSTINKIPVDNSKIESNQAILGISKQALHVEKVEDSNNLENVTTIDSEDSEVDVVTVFEPYRSWSSSYSEEDKINKNKETEKQRRLEIRKHLNFLHSVIPNTIISPSALSIKTIVDAAINYIKIVKTESEILEKMYNSELHQQNKLIKKLQDIKRSQRKN